jgi:hypothetical protein
MKQQLSSKQHKALTESKSNSFGKSYFQICQVLSLPILTHLIHHDPTTLLLAVDKVHKDEEWAPILIALKKNRDLGRITLFSSEATPSSIREVGHRFHQSNKPVKTVFRILPELIGGIRDGLLFNTHLASLDINGIPLRETTLKLLAKGLLNNTRLRYLSLSQTQIGDSGVFILAPSIRTIRHLMVLNLSACSLSEKGAHIISSFLKSLAVRRQADCWAHSLRFSPLDNDPSLSSQHSKDAPKPLKRLIMCKNELGEKGAAPLFDLLYEEVGLAALDLEYCGLGKESARKALEVLKVNRDLVLLDLRNNEIGISSYLQLRCKYFGKNTKLSLGE